MTQDSANKLTKTTIALHWVVGLLFLGLLISGIYMETNEVWSLYPIHKSIGVIIFIFALAQVIRIIKRGHWLPPVGTHKPYEITLAKIVKWLLIIGTVLMPVSGFLMSSMGGHGVSVFGLELFPRMPDPASPQEVIPVNAAVAGFAHTMHGLGGNLMIAAVVLHIVGAYKHHFGDKDGTMKRMLGKEV